MKQTAVEWLVEHLQKSKDWQRVLNEVSQMSSAKINLLEQAKEMEKEQSESICVNVIERILDKLEKGEEINSKEIFEQYYKETFKSK